MRTDLTLKILFVGPKKSGKTSLKSYFIRKACEEELNKLENDNGYRKDQGYIFKDSSYVRKLKELMSKIEENIFSEEYNETKMLEPCSIRFCYEDDKGVNLGTVNIQIWDIPGDEEFLSTNTLPLLKGSKCLFFFVVPGAAGNVEDAVSYSEKLEKYINGDVECHLAINKLELNTHYFYDKDDNQRFLAADLITEAIQKAWGNKIKFNTHDEPCEIKEIGGNEITARKKNFFECSSNEKNDKAAPKIYDYIKKLGKDALITELKRRESPEISTPVARNKTKDFCCTTLLYNAVCCLFCCRCSSRKTSKVHPETELIDTNAAARYDL